MFPPSRQVGACLPAPWLPHGYTSTAEPLVAEVWGHAGQEGCRRAHPVLRRSLPTAAARTATTATRPAHCCHTSPPQPALRLRWDLLADYPVFRDFLRSPVWPDGIKFE